MAHTFKVDDFLHLEPATIDWTKPVWYRSPLATKTPLEYVGLHNSKLVFWDGSAYVNFNKDGSGAWASASPEVVLENVPPPPPVWPAEAWIVTDNTGVAHFVRNRDAINTVLKEMRWAGRSVKITPITLTGPV